MKLCTSIGGLQERKMIAPPFGASRLRSALAGQASISYPLHARLYRPDAATRQSTLSARLSMREQERRAQTVRKGRRAVRERRRRGGGGSLHAESRPRRTS